MPIEIGQIEAIFRYPVKSDGVSRNGTVSLSKTAAPPDPPVHSSMHKPGRRGPRRTHRLFTGE
jgi:hypothetical protein